MSEMNENTSVSESELVAEEKRPNYLLQAWLVIFLSVLYGAILVWVQMSLSEKIEANKKNATFAQIPTLVKGAEPSKTQELAITGTDGKPARVYQVFNADGMHIGWVFPGLGQGFSDVISVIIGLDAEAKTITGLYVLDQKETPGLGNFIQDEPFRSQFVGKATMPPLAVVKSEPVAENEILALTGATISSKAVSDIVNSTVARYRDAAIEVAK